MPETIILEKRGDSNSAGEEENQRSISFKGGENLKVSLTLSGTESNIRSFETEFDVEELNSKIEVKILKNAQRTLASTSEEPKKDSE